MKKIRTLAALLLTVGMLAGCGDGSQVELDGRVALITDLGDIDDKSFNQGSWEGVLAFNEQYRVDHQYYKPSEGTNAAYIESIELAIDQGATIVVTPGFLFEVAVHEMQIKHPEVRFILLDAAPKNPETDEYYTAPNTASILYAEEQSGYLAGYGVVKDGHRKLGYMGGMSVPAVRRFGLGYLVGAHDAAVELGLEDNAIEVKYHYTGGFDATPEARAKADSWYVAGTTVIFACGGSVGQSVMAAAGQRNGKVVGVDVDQAGDHETVMTSATKGLAASVELALKQHYELEGHKWEGGKTTVLDASNDGVGLPTAEESWRFESFSIEEYNEIYGKLADESVTIIDRLPADYLETPQEDAANTLGGSGEGSLAKVTVIYEG